MTRSASLAKAREFVRLNALVLGVVALVMVLAYGFAVTSFALSIDEDTAFYVDWTNAWVTQGRPVIPLIKVVLGNHLALPFFNLALALAILFLAGVMWAFLITEAARPARVGKASLLVFLIVFTTLPVNAYYLAFNTYNVEVSLAWVWAAASVWLAWLWAMQARGWLALVASVVFVVLAALTYQDFSFVVIAGVLIVQLAHLLGCRSRDVYTTREAIRQTVTLAIPIVAGLAVAAVVSLLIIESGGRIASLFWWGSENPVVLVLRIIARIGLFAIGLGFEGGWVIIPTIAAGVLVVVLVAIKGLHERQWYPLALLLLISIMPFGLTIAVGHGLPNRAMQAVVLVAASVWLLLPLVIHARKQLGMALLVVAALFAVWNADITTRSFVTEHQTYEADRAVAREIGERLVREGWDGSEQISIVTIGRRAQGPLELLASDQFVGFSLFNDIDGRRSPGFMRLMGYQMRNASAVEAAAARDRSTSMPAWPAEDSVVFEDGLAIVKFSEP